MKLEHIATLHTLDELKRNLQSNHNVSTTALYGNQHQQNTCSQYMSTAANRPVSKDMLLRFTTTTVKMLHTQIHFSHQLS